MRRERKLKTRKEKRKENEVEPEERKKRKEKEPEGIGEVICFYPCTHPVDRRGGVLHNVSQLIHGRLHERDLRVRPQ